MISNINIDSENQTPEEGEDQEESPNISQSYNDYSNKDQSNTEVQSPCSSSDNNSYRDEHDAELESNYFYIERMKNEQLQAMIKLFIVNVLTNNKDSEDKLKDIPSNIIFSLPTKLWIEKQGNNDKETGSNYNEQLTEEDILTDFVEDSIDATNENRLKESVGSTFPYAAKLVSSTGDIKANKHEESGYLIYERHFEAQPLVKEDEKDIEIETPDESAIKDPNFDDDLNTEDLGIIDIEDDDVFDDDKLPFLKRNTYSK